MCKLSDRDGMYIVVVPSGLTTFRYDYRLNDGRETLTFARSDRYKVRAVVAFSSAIRFLALMQRRAELGEMLS